jgi:hypothetical protein
MGHFSLADTLDTTKGETVETIDTLVEEYSTTTQPNPPPQIHTSTSYGEFTLSEDEDLVLDLTSTTTFTGLSELDETAISPYQKE